MFIKPTAGSTLIHGKVFKGLFVLAETSQDPLGLPRVR